MMTTDEIRAMSRGELALLVAGCQAELERRGQLGIPPSRPRLITPDLRIRYNYLPQQFDEATTEAILGELRDLARTGDFTLGAPVVEFERRLGVMLRQHVIGTNSGTDALILALKAFGIGPGDEVITQANTFYATVGAIVAVGARPVFVDVNECYAMDETKLEAAIGPRTRAVLPVWWTGVAPDLAEIGRIAAAHRLVLIEDACPALGASYHDKPPGTFSHAAAFSFHPLKPLNVWGDGGAVVTNDDRAATWLRLYRNHGLVSRDEIALWGVNQRLQSVQAVVANHLLDQVGGWVDRRNEIADYLDTWLGYIPGITVPPRLPDRTHAFQLYMVRAQRRDALLTHLTTHFIEAKVHYPVPLHLQPPGKALGYQVGDFPMAEQQAQEILTLPCHPWLTMNGIPGEDQVEHLTWQIRRFYECPPG